MKPDCWICSKCPYRSISNPKINHTFALLDVPCTGPIIPIYSRESLVKEISSRIEKYKVNVTFYGQPEISILNAENETVKELESLKASIMEEE